MFKSSEIRWFSKKKDLLWNFYENLPEKGEGNREPDRTDYYLKSGTIKSGIKIREGNHELKVKSGEDEKLDFGVMEHWFKWSSTEEKNILNTIDDELLDEWISVEKKRFKKTYEISHQGEMRMIKEGFPSEGCGAEFTEIQLREIDKPLYTIGLEAFSSSGRQRENLMLFLENLDTDFLTLRELDSYGYPQLLHGLGDTSK